MAQYYPSKRPAPRSRYKYPSRRYSYGGKDNSQGYSNYKKSYRKYPASSYSKYKYTKKYSGAAKRTTGSKLVKTVKDRYGQRKELQTKQTRVVVSEGGGVASADIVPKNGVRVRFTNLSESQIPSTDGDCTDGRVKWKGYRSEYLYELGFPGPFCHRRIEFVSTSPWAVSQLNSFRSVDSVADGDDGDDSSNGYSCAPAARPSSDRNLARCIYRLFSERNVRGLLYGSLDKDGIRVLQDQLYSFTGTENGVRIRKKQWNGYGVKGGTATLLYAPGTGKVYGPGLSDASPWGNVYAVDVYQFGKDGLDLPLPNPKTMMMTGLSGQPVQKSGKGKRQKAVDFDDNQEDELARMEGLSFDAKREGIEKVDLMAAEEDSSEYVSITGVSTLYWYGTE